MRAAVVGSNWGAVHVAALREAGVEVVALVGLEPEATARAAHRLGIALSLTDVAQLGDLDLDLVGIATPAPTHATMLATLPDVPALCEKPAVGLAPPLGLPPGRTAPVWVNYAFAFLEVARRAAAALDRIGPVLAARATSQYDLPELALSPSAMFMELVPHPWSWLASMLGPTRPAPGAAQAVEAEDGVGVWVAARCGEVPTLLRSLPAPGLHGIAHEVTVRGEQGTLTVRGTYRVGEPWRYAPPELRLAAGVAGGGPLGSPEQGPGDPWYRANARAIGAVVDALRGAPVSPLLFDWNAALALDRTAQASLPGTVVP